MAKRKKKNAAEFKECSVPNCLGHKFWPTIVPLLHGPMADAWVDTNSGELFVATGLKVLPNLQLVPMDRLPDSVVMAECDCGLTTEVRRQLLNDGRVDRCWRCAAAAAVAQSN